MGKYTIEVDSLGKRYRLGELERYDYNLLRDVVSATAKS